jgi:hypothetical protein
MSLTFEPETEDSIPIARIKGKKEGFVYLNDDEEYTLNGDRIASPKLRKLKAIDNDTQFFPLVNILKDNNDRIFVCGKSGVGKTYRFIRPYVKEFKQTFKNSKVYLFSSKAEDKALDDLPIQRITVEEDFIDNPIDIKQLTNKNGQPNLIIFDDIQDYPHKSQNVAVARLRDEIMRNGRSLGLYTVYVWHKPADRKNTEQQIFESTATVIFPKQSGHDDYDYLMDRYLGIKDIKMKNLLKKSKSDFVYVTKKSPAVAISNNYIILL